MLKFLRRVRRTFFNVFKEHAKFPWVILTISFGILVNQWPLLRTRKRLRKPSYLVCRAIPCLHTWHSICLCYQHYGNVATTARKNCRYPSFLLRWVKIFLGKRQTSLNWFPQNLNLRADFLYISSHDVYILPKFSHKILRTPSLQLQNESIELDARPEYARAKISMRRGKFLAEITGIQVSTSEKSHIELIGGVKRSYYWAGHQPKVNWPLT